MKGTKVTTRLSLSLLPPFLRCFHSLTLPFYGCIETLPPLSIYTPPSSHPSLLQLLPLSLSQPPPPPTTASTSTSSSQPSSSSSSVLADTSILIVLDWTKPASMIVQLLGWLEWVDEWSRNVVKGREVEGEENRERCTFRQPTLSPLLSSIFPRADHLASSFFQYNTTSNTTPNPLLLPLLCPLLPSEEPLQRNRCSLSLQHP